jgi:hypothetical protein
LRLGRCHHAGDCCLVPSEIRSCAPFVMRSEVKEVSSNGTL